MSDHKFSVEELEHMLADAKAEAAHEEFPKWVEVHESHVERKSAADGSSSVAVPGFLHHMVDRVTHAISVMVHDAEEEAKAVAVKAE